jgi:hypothetical protein
MDKDYGEDELGCAEMSGEELSEIVNARPGRYPRELVEGARAELERREREGVRADADAQPVTAQPLTAGPLAPPPPGPAPDGKLYSAGQITLATFLGAPLAGGLFLARNYQVLGQGAAAWRALAVGIGATAALLALALLLPENFPSAGLPAGSCIAMYCYAKQWRGGAIDAHLKAGAENGPWALVVAVGIGCAVLVFGLLVAAAVTFDLGAPEDFRDMPVAHVRVSQAGEVELDGTVVTRGQLRAALNRVRDAGGGVMYYRERWDEPPSAEAVKALEVIRAAGLPVRVSSKPDFSDYIGPDGVPVPAR